MFPANAVKYSIVTCQFRSFSLNKIRDCNYEFNITVLSSYVDQKPRCRLSLKKRLAYNLQVFILFSSPWFLEFLLLDVSKAIGAAVYSNPQISLPNSQLCQLLIFTKKKANQNTKANLHLVATFNYSLFLVSPSITLLDCFWKKIFALYK